MSDQLVQKAHEVVEAMCHGGKWTMSIPVQPTDSDVVISGALVALEQQLAEAKGANQPARDEPEQCTLDAYRSTNHELMKERDSLREQIELTKQIYQCSIDAREQIIKDLREQLRAAEADAKYFREANKSGAETLYKQNAELEAALAEANRQRDEAYRFSNQDQSDRDGAIRENVELRKLIGELSDQSHGTFAEGLEAAALHVDGYYKAVGINATRLLADIRAIQPAGNAHRIYYSAVVAVGRWRIHCRLGSTIRHRTHRRGQRYRQNVWLVEPPATGQKEEKG